MLEALSYGFMQNALWAGVLAGVACGVIGSLVVANRIVFLAGAVAHAAYGGVGLAFFMGWPVLPCTVGFTLAAGGGMAAATVRGLERADKAIGVLWAGGMALGVLLMDLTPGYNADVMSYLFGSLMAVPIGDVWLMLGLDAVVVVLALVFYKHFVALSFDREYARTRGVPVAAMHFLMLGMIAVAVVMVIRVVGLILVIALLSIPAGMAQERARSLMGMMVLSSALAVAFCLGGLALAYRFDLTSGAAVIAVAVAAYAADAAWRRLTRR